MRFLYYDKLESASLKYLLIVLTSLSVSVRTSNRIVPCCMYINMEVFIILGTCNQLSFSSRHDTCLWSM